MKIGSIGTYENFNSYNKYDNSDNPKVDDNKQSTSQECETCKNRKYVDGSNDVGVSFKSPTHVSPEAASAAVRAHEGMHVSNAFDRASQNNGKVINASVSIHTSVCPECGRTYVSGGTTNTQIKYYNESNPYQKELKSSDSLKYTGANVDLSA